MTSKVERAQRGAFWSVLLPLAAFLLVLSLPRQASAQWTAPDSQGNINNTNTGNVGIGTSTPGRRLEVLATDGEAARLYRNANFVDWGVNVKFALNNSSNLLIDYAGLHGQISSPAAGAENGNMLFTTVTAGSLTEKMRITSAGNVGVGTVTPASKLDVAGASGVTFRTSGASAGVSIFDRPSVPGDQIVLQGNTGNYSVLNIATKNANFGSEKLAGFSMWTVENTYTPNATQFQLQNSPAFGGVIFTQKFGTGAQGDKKVSFQTAWNQTTVPTQFVLDTNGNVGIGTASPQHKLDVSGNMTIGSAYSSSVMVPLNGLIVEGGVGIGTSAPAAQYKLDVVGDVRVSGNISAKYQDVAEWVPSTQQLSAGTVVVVDAAGVNHVLASTASYDTGVAGVVSVQPGLILGEGGEGKVMVATTGRVKVKVDATRAPIRAGDLLVTSGAAGVAMRSEPVSVGGVQMHRPGTIVGKALEPLAKGTGEILVLLSLQ